MEGGAPCTAHRSETTCTIRLETTNPSRRAARPPRPALDAAGVARVGVEAAVATGRRLDRQRRRVQPVHPPSSPTRVAWATLASAGRRNRAPAGRAADAGGGGAVGVRRSVTRPEPRRRVGARRPRAPTRRCRPCLLRVERGRHGARRLPRLRSAYRGRERPALTAMPVGAGGRTPKGAQRTPVAGLRSRLGPRRARGREAGPGTARADRGASRRRSRPRRRKPTWSQAFRCATTKRCTRCRAKVRTTLRPVAHVPGAGGGRVHAPLG
jgi:hypothetical protein